MLESIFKTNLFLLGSEHLILVGKGVMKIWLATQNNIITPRPIQMQNKLISEHANIFNSTAALLWYTQIQLFVMKIAILWHLLKIYYPSGSENKHNIPFLVPKTLHPQIFLTPPPPVLNSLLQHLTSCKTRYEILLPLLDRKLQLIHQIGVNLRIVISFSWLCFTL